MTSNITLAVQTPAPGEYVELFTLNAIAIGSGVFHFTLSEFSNTAPLLFNGVSYPPLDVEFTGMETTSVGSIPQPTLRVRNHNYILSTLIADFADGVGATLSRIRTFGCFLDGQPEADPNAYISQDTFIIEQKTSADNVAIEWKLSSVLDQQGMMLPARNVLRDTCTLVYRIYDNNLGVFDYSRATCPYVDGNYFTILDQSTNLPFKDECSHLLSGCKLRFGGNPIPASFFPGAGRFSSGFGG
jgi:lambda family phage minor tail protein L